MTPDTVWVAANATGGNCDVYHSDRDCQGLTQAKTVNEWRAEEIQEWRELCQLCADSKVEQEHDRSYYHALKKEAE